MTKFAYEIIKEPYLKPKAVEVKEMLLNPGVYQPVGDENVRIIIFEGDNCDLYIGEDTVEAFDKQSWGKTKFIQKKENVKIVVGK